MINDWGLTYNLVYPKKIVDRLKANERESFAVKLCPKCNRTYEMTHSQYKKISTTHYYKNFPKRGLHNQMCFACEEKE